MARHATLAALSAVITIMAAMAASSAYAQTDGMDDKAGDELAGMIEMIRTMGADVSALPDAQAAPFADRMERLLASPGDEAAKAAGSLTIMAEYGLAALAQTDKQTDENDQAREYLTRLAEISRRYSTTEAAGGSVDSIAAELNALEAEYGMRFVPEDNDESEAKEAGEETIEMYAEDGSMITLTGERAEEFMRRSDDIGMRYAAAYDVADTEARTASLIAIENEYYALLEEYGLSTARTAAEPTAEEAEIKAAAEKTIEFTGADGSTVTLTGERATEFNSRIDALWERYDAAYAQAASTARTATLAALEAEYDAILVEFGAAQQAPATEKGPDPAPEHPEDAPSQ